MFLSIKEFFFEDLYLFCSTFLLGKGKRNFLKFSTRQEANNQNEQLENVFLISIIIPNNFNAQFNKFKRTMLLFSVAYGKLSTFLSFYLADQFLFT